MIQKQSNSRHSGQSIITKINKGATGLKFNREHAHCFFFFPFEVIVLREFVPSNTAVNSDFYCDILRCMKENVWWKWLKIWQNHNWLHHDNVRALASLKTTEFVTNNSMDIVPRPSYFLDLGPMIFCLLSQMENETEGMTFWNSVWHPKESQVVLNSIKENDSNIAF
jgi:hypothetical protein